MFIYKYQCACGVVYETQSCGKNHCRGKKKKLVQTISRSFPKTVGNARVTTYSRAMAIDPSQLEEAKRLHPDRNYVYNAKEHICMLEVNGAHHQARLAKEEGMVDYSGTKVSK